MRTLTHSLGHLTTTKKNDFESNLHLFYSFSNKIFMTYCGGYLDSCACHGYGRFQVAVIEELLGRCRGYVLCHVPL